MQAALILKAKRDHKRTKTTASSAYSKCKPVYPEGGYTLVEPGRSESFADCVLNHRLGDFTWHYEFAARTLPACFCVSRTRLQSGLSVFRTSKLLCLSIVFLVARSSTFAEYTCILLLQTVRLQKCTSFQC